MVDFKFVENLYVYPAHFLMQNFVSTDRISNMFSILSAVSVSKFVYDNLFRKQKDISLISIMPPCHKFNILSKSCHEFGLSLAMLQDEAESLAIQRWKGTKTQIDMRSRAEIILTYNK